MTLPKPRESAAEAVIVTSTGSEAIRNAVGTPYLEVGESVPVGCQGWHASEGQDARERGRQSRKPPTDEGSTLGTEARHELCRRVSMPFSRVRPSKS